MKHCIGKVIRVRGGVIKKLFYSRARYWKSLLPATEQYKSHMKHCIGKLIRVQGGVIKKSKPSTVLEKSYPDLAR
jgi:hypothetical protein